MLTEKPLLQIQKPSATEAVPQLILSTKKSLLFVFKALFVFLFLAFFGLLDSLFTPHAHLL